MFALLVMTLDAAVPLNIMEFARRGGPDKADFDDATAFGQVLAEKGDVLLFGSKQKGQAADLFNRLARAIAVLSFCPGGVHLFGRHWQAPAAKPSVTRPRLRRGD